MWNMHECMALGPPLWASVMRQMRLLFRSKMIIVGVIDQSQPPEASQQKVFLADLCGEGSELDISGILDEPGVTVFPFLWHI